jgi:dTDP-4-dehydrorhamnose 3,5-epimerase
VTSLKRIPADGGDVMHALKNSDNGFIGFGEVYFSWVKKGAVKAWKCHQSMTLNLVVPLGEIRFVFHLAEQNNDFRIENLGNNCYSRLTVPPGIWFGFQGISSGSSLLMNVSDMEHNPNEVLYKPVSVSDSTFNWSLE